MVTELTSSTTQFHFLPNSYANHKYISIDPFECPNCISIIVLGVEPNKVSHSKIS
ncbi:hypothetical protein [Pseudomonas sp. 31 R 17]|nr:hypothetical protein [Pseudomonas sp. 31 R 17]